MSITIFHNPACSTSRLVLDILRASGCDPVVIAYPQTGWTRAQLEDLFAAAGIAPRAGLRLKTPPAADLGLADPATPDDTILQAMVAHPQLVERPFVRSPRGTRLCRPPERVLDLITPPALPLYHPDGRLLLDAAGKPAKRG